MYFFDIIFNRYHYFANDITKSTMPYYAAYVFSMITLSIGLSGVALLSGIKTSGYIPVHEISLMWILSFVFMLFRYVIFGKKYQLNAQRIKESKYASVYGIITIFYTIFCWYCFIHAAMNKY